MSSQSSFRPVTVGDLRRAGELLEVGCTKCLNVDYIEPDALGFPEDEVVSGLFQHLRCSLCGEEAGYSHPGGWWAAVEAPSPPPV